MVLAFSNLASWGALTAAVSSLVAAWSKFEVVDKKLQRFSDAIAGLQNVERWWNLLGSVEKANLNKISLLVDNCENIFQNERQGWVTTSMAIQLLDQAGKDSKNTAEKMNNNGYEVSVPVD